MGAELPFPLRLLCASKPDAIGPVLAIVHRVIAGWLDRCAVKAATRQSDQTDIDRTRAQCGAVTLIQRFGSVLNLNIHSHMLWLDGVYEEDDESPLRKPSLHRTRAPTSAQMTEPVGTIAHRVCRHLTRLDWLEGEDVSAFLADSAAGDDGMDALRMSSITYRIATDKPAGRKVITLQTLPGDAGPLEGDAGKVGGFSLHPGVTAEAHESQRLERLCRYIARPAISERPVRSAASKLSTKTTSLACDSVPDSRARIAKHSAALWPCRSRNRLKRVMNRPPAIRVADASAPLVNPGRTAICVVEAQSCCTPQPLHCDRIPPARPVLGRFRGIPYRGSWRARSSAPGIRDILRFAAAAGVPHPGYRSMAARSSELKCVYFLVMPTP
jgi:hypothetical protein